MRLSLRWMPTISHDGFPMERIPTRGEPFNYRSFVDRHHKWRWTGVRRPWPRRVLRSEQVRCLKRSLRSCLGDTSLALLLPVKPYRAGKTVCTEQLGHSLGRRPIIRCALGTLVVFGLGLPKESQQYRLRCRGRLSASAPSVKRISVGSSGMGANRNESMLAVFHPSSTVAPAIPESTTIPRNSPGPPAANVTVSISAPSESNADSVLCPPKK